MIFRIPHRKKGMQRIFLKTSRELLPRITAKYPFIYLEHGRLEVDDSSIKWLGADRTVVSIPVATINSILLGPGTSITHAAIKNISEANCLICWVGSDSLLYYATGISPTSDTYNLKRQVKLVSNSRSKLEIARKMFQIRFPEVDLSGKSLAEMQGMEGVRVRKQYSETAIKYGITWDGESEIRSV